MKKMNFKFFYFIALSLVALLSSCKGQGEEQKASVWEVDPTHKFWVWLNPQEGESDTDVSARYKKYYDAGVKGIFFGTVNEQHFRLAKEQGLEAHHWMWIMNRGEDFIRENHPEWYAVNRKGESCFDKPPYVGYYRWLCPSRPEVAEYLKGKVKESLDKEYVDGIHLDYVRYSDGVLASNLWDVYGIVQTEELPEYDYCYCDICKAKFKEEYGQDIDSIAYPTESLSWKKFRYDGVNNIVAQLTQVAEDHNKAITAAVFPTPDVAKRLVKQDWTNWQLSAVFPMIYHGFYKENTSWIGTAVQEGLRGLDGRFPLYAGLYLPDFKDVNDIRDGVKYALDNGASGVSLFGDMNDEILSMIKEFK